MFYMEGTGSLGGVGNVSIPNVDQVEFIGVQVGGTFVGTVVFQVTCDGTNWVTVAAKDLTSGTGALVTSLTAVGLVQLDVRGVKGCRVACTAYTSGTITLAWVLEREF